MQLQLLFSNISKRPIVKYNKPKKALKKNQVLLTKQHTYLAKTSPKGIAKDTTDALYASLVPGSVPFMSSFVALAQARFHLFSKQKEYQYYALPP